MQYRDCIVSVAVAICSSSLRRFKHARRNDLSVFAELSGAMDETVRPEQLLSALLETSEQAVIGISLDGAVQNWNAAAERLYGYTGPEIIGQPVSRLVPL